MVLIVTAISDSQAAQVAGARLCAVLPPRAGSASLGKDWDAVARAIDERLVGLDMTQAELASRAGVALETVRELRKNLRPRRRNPRTLAAISRALGWEPGHLAQVLNGDGVAAENAPAVTTSDLDALRQAYADLADRVTAIERRLDSQ